VNELWDATLPWYGWALILIGAVALVSVFGALFLPDWKEPEFSLGELPEPGSEGFVNGVGAFLGTPVARGGTIELLQNGDKFYPAMLEAIRGARDTVNFEVYIFEPDEIGRQFIDAFMERSLAGIEVRLLVDGFGSFKLKKEQRRELQRAGVKVERFRPFGLNNLVRVYRRSHRRALVIDGRIAFTGGAAISKKWAGDVRTAHEWRDSMVRITGPLVSGIQAAFAGNWVYCTGEMLSGERFFPGAAPAAGPCSVSVMSSPSDAQQPIRLLFWLTMVNARRRLWICNSYFIPDPRLRTAVVNRARQGVDVRILVPGNHTDAVPVQLAGRSYYEELLEAGVRIFEFQPAMMHAKTIVADDAWSVVGSANMDERSMELNEENLIGVADEGLARAITEGNERDFARSREVKLETWRKRPPRQRGLEAVAKVLIEQY
jgi:cardiolipin synthase